MPGRPYWQAEASPVDRRGDKRATTVRPSWKEKFLRATCWRPFVRRSASGRKCLKWIQPVARFSSRTAVQSRRCCHDAFPESPCTIVLGKEAIRSPQPLSPESRGEGINEHDCARDCVHSDRLGLYGRR